MKLLASLGILCLAGSAASAWIVPGLATTHAFLGAAATASARAADAGTDPSPDYALCITAFSKDDCDGMIDPGNYKSTGCDATGCRTVIVTDAVYQTRLRGSNLTCAVICDASKCDEFPNGTLTLKFDYVLRTDSCCPYRGSWHGDWDYVTSDGRRFAGQAHGTIGVGTNRDSACPVADDACEKCYDVELIDGFWQIGFEGSFRGRSVFSPLPFPEELNFTTDGTWIVSALHPEPFRQPFTIRSRFDGSYLRWSCN